MENILGAARSVLSAQLKLDTNCDFRENFTFVTS